jgi:hypothetical protein
LELPHQLACLLRHPGCSWVHGATSQMDPTGADLDEEQSIHGFQPQRFYGEEITGQQVLLVLPQKGTPGAALPGARGGCRNMLACEDVSNG